LRKRAVPKCTVQETAANATDEKEIREKRHKLLTARLAADRKALPHGLPVLPKLEVLAKQTTEHNFKNLYPDED
jgi:hypothetical protein